MRQKKRLCYGVVDSVSSHQHGQTASDPGRFGGAQASSVRIQRAILGEKNLINFAYFSKIKLKLNCFFLVERPCPYCGWRLGEAEAAQIFTAGR